MPESPNYDETVQPFHTILSEVFSSAGVSCCALPLNEDVHLERKKEVEQKLTLMSHKFANKFPNECACESGMVVLAQFHFFLHQDLVVLMPQHSTSEGDHGPWLAQI